MNKLSNEKEQKISFWKKHENFFRWMGLPFVILFSKIPAHIIFAFQWIFVDPNSMYATLIIPMLIEATAGFLAIYLGYQIAPKGKLTVANITFGLFIALAGIAILAQAIPLTESIPYSIGMIIGIIQSHEEDKKLV